MATDENTTKVVKIKGTITDYLKDKKDLQDLGSIREFDLSKTASPKDFVEVRVKDKERGLYSILVSFVDKSGQIFKNQAKNFGSVNEMKARGILKAIGYDIPKVSEILFKAKTQGFLVFQVICDCSFYLYNLGCVLVSCHN
jgi:hypothetical protein